MHSFLLGALALWLISGPAASQGSGSPADGPWWGSVKCTIEVSEGSNQRSEAQTWTLSGAAPTVQGAMRIFPAMWSVTGQGAVIKNPRAPATQWTASVPNREVLLAAFVRASDGKLIFRQWSVRAEVAKAVTMSQSAMPAAAVNEWDFGWIETNESQANFSGVRTATAPAPPAQMSVGGPAPVPSCDWQFSRNDPNLPPPPATQTANTRPARRPLPPGVVLTPPTALPAPASVQAAYVGPHTVTLTWAAVTGAANYRIDGTGVAAGGITADANATSVTINNVPNGAGGWTVGALRGGQTTPEQTAGASLMVRELPAHAPAFLSKNNGAGNAALTLAHYTSACSMCIPGMTFADVAKDLGFPLTTLQGTSNWEGSDNFSWQDTYETRYSNDTVFAHSVRTSRCWPPAAGRTLCYANDSHHGLTVIVRQGASSWFMTFASKWPGSQVLENGGPGGDTEVTSDYKLTTGFNVDSEGEKHAPYACVACHGGRVNAGGPVTGATLLPLVLAGTIWYDKHADLLNKQILDTSPPASVVRYLYGVYGGNPQRVGATVNKDYVPAGWSNNQGLYRQVIRPYCISCHLNTPGGVDLSSEASAMQWRAQIVASVCDAHSMPHAEEPFKDFWTRDTGSVFLPGLLSAAFGGGDCH